jgi:DNA helicase-2/ATP-dependent DNA helicase PcrA
MTGKTKPRATNHLLESLNSVQRKAVLCTQGPVLVLAGAGSGKTRVLTHRVAYLLEQKGVKPWQILAVTFTNKAANEMKERISKIAKGLGNQVWIGTFHSICARILRIEGERLGFGRNFLIFDRQDQASFIKSIMNEINISPKRYASEAVLARISGAKNLFISPEEYNSTAKDSFEETVALVYSHYQKRMKENNTMDFDDLLVNVIHLFEQFPQVLNNYQNRFRHILVDEYQDVNRIQYLLLRMLASKHRNLCVVGDDDQSIYRWRGADIRNILEFERGYPDCKVFHLEQNYRSTQNILNAANSVVRNNFRRREKVLWTKKEFGEKVTSFEVDDETSESLLLVEIIKNELTQYGRNFCDFAILYRTNAQSRVLEEALRSAGIPYVLVGGVRFYERKEIKDVLSYLRLICNTQDSISFKRVINFPLRGIGEGSLAKLVKFAHEQSISLFEAAGRIEEVTAIAPRIRTNIAEFFTLISKYNSIKSEFSPGELARALVEEIGILKTFKEIGTEESSARAENVRELLSAIVNFTQKVKKATLEDFLEEVSLITDIDSWDDKSNAVTLMTLHSAKGLEFPVVFITGLEEGLFPLKNALNSIDELEEERRLFYVGATRAKEKLYLSWAAQRMRFGERCNSLPSRFIKEIAPEFLAQQNLRKFYQSRTYPPDVEKMPAYEDFSQEVREIFVGCEVRHSQFGVGKITTMEGRGENLKITVNFYDHGEKRLVVKYANLEILE